MDNCNIFYQSVDECYCYDLIIYDEFLAVSLKINGCGMGRWGLGNIVSFWLLLMMGMMGMMAVFVGGWTVGYHESGNPYFLLILILHLLFIVWLS